MRKTVKYQVRDWNILVGLSEDYPQAECRWTTPNGSQMLVIVGHDGFNTKYDKREPDRWGNSTKGYNIRLSTNQAAWMTLEHWSTLDEVVRRALGYLSEYERNL